MEDEEDGPPKKRNYITLEGYRRLAAELDNLQRVERPRVCNEVTEAAAQGDRSENAEYIYGKKRLREIDKRLAFIQARLDLLKVVDPRESEGSQQVFFGATVTVEDENGKRSTYQIVGEDELDAKGTRISINGPMASALLKKKVGEVATVKRPAGEVDVTVVKVTYG